MRDCWWMALAMRAFDGGECVHAEKCFGWIGCRASPERERETRKTLDFWELDLPIILVLYSFRLFFVFTFFFLHFVVCGIICAFHRMTLRYGSVCAHANCSEWCTNNTNDSKQIDSIIPERTQAIPWYINLTQTSRYMHLHARNWKWFQNWNTAKDKRAMQQIIHTQTQTRQEKLCCWDTYTWRTYHILHSVASELRAYLFVYKMKFFTLTLCTRKCFSWQPNQLSINFYLLRTAQTHSHSHMYMYEYQGDTEDRERESDGRTDGRNIGPEV